MESEDNNEDLLGIANDAQSNSDGDSDLEENLAKTARRNDRLERSRTESELCSCNFEGQPTLKPNAAPEVVVCGLCGNAITRNRTQQGKLNRSHVNPNQTEETLLSVFPQSYSGHLPTLPSVSLEDEVCGTSTQAASLKTVQASVSQLEKIPVIRKFDNLDLLCSEMVCVNSTALL